jgi:hypothetical protein
MRAEKRTGAVPPSTDQAEARHWAPGTEGTATTGAVAAIGGDAAPGAIQLLPFQAERQRVGRLRGGQDQAAIRRGGQGQAMHAAMFQRLAAAGFHGARLRAARAERGAG